MSTYPIEKVLSEYEHDRMNVEMAVGHNLQHTSKLYQAQTAANVEHYDLKNRVFNLEFEVKSLRGEVERLTTTQVKPSPSSRRGSRRKQQKDEP